MERYHIYKLGLAIIFYAVYCGREAVANGLRADDVTQSATDNRERRDAVDDTIHFHRSADGVPGVDFPNLAYVPKTKFNCRDVDAGYYADLETDCQVFHICDEGRKISFLCPNGTIFQQAELICDWWFKVNCTSSPSLYETSAEVLQRENAKRKESRRIYKGTKQGVFSNIDNSNLERFATPAHFVTPSYRKSKENIFSTSTENLFKSSNILPSSFSKSKPKSKTSSNYRRDEGTLNTSNEGNNYYRTRGQSGHAAFNVNHRNKPDHQIVYGRTKQTKNSAETQEVQETGSFVQNLQNKVFGSNKKEATSAYPNHRTTYSEIRDPSNYVGKAYSKLPDKPFYGSSVTPQLLSTIPVTKQSGYTLTTERNTFKIAKQPVNSTTVKIVRKDPKNVPGTTKAPTAVLLQIVSTKSVKNGVETVSKPTTKQKPKNNRLQTDSPLINVNVLPLSALPSFDENGRRGKSPNSRIENSKLIRISTNNGKEENTLSVNFSTNKQPFKLPDNHKPTFSDDLNIFNFNDKFVEEFRPANQQVSQKVLLRSQNSNQETGPYIYDKPDTRGYGNSSKNGVEINNESYSFATSNPNEIRNRFNIGNNVELSKNNGHANNVQFNLNNKIYNVTTEQYPTTDSIRSTVNINNKDYTVSISPKVTTVAPNPLGISTDETILYTSPTTIFQPHPFSHNKISTTSELPQLKQYQVSSASPFSTPNENKNLINTPAPTLPTPFLSSSPEETNNAINENINGMINILMQVINQKNLSDTDLNYATSRPGLIVPPSVGPQTLHSLAIYFANSLDNLTLARALEQSTESSSDSKPININSEDLIRSLLTKMTEQNYNELFGKPTETTTEIDNAENDLIREDTKSPVQELSVRKLARVFTEALSSYLEDPEMFKRVIQEARPTEPPPLPNEVETDEDEVLNYSDSDLKFDHPHLSTRPVPLQVNPTWGYILSYNNKSRTESSLDVQNSITNEQENLQSSDSQSFVSQLNKLAQATKNEQSNAQNSPEANALSIDKKPLPRDHWTTSSDVTKLWQNTLFINPAALNHNFGTTKSVESLELDTSSTKYFGESLEDSSAENALSSKSESGITSFDNALAPLPTSEVEINYELRSLPKLQLNMTQVHGILVDFMQSNRTKGSEKFHRLLDKLNITQDEFLDKMKEIEDNPVTRRLILLLISECNQSEHTKNLMHDELFGKKNSKLLKEVESSNVGTTTRTTLSSDFEDSSEESTEPNIFNRIVNPSLKDGNEDTRALELLNSLYVIASKFGR